MVDSSSPKMDSERGWQERPGRMVETMGKCLMCRPSSVIDSAHSRWTTMTDRRRQWKGVEVGENVRIEPSDH
jgi:hypothetical protein